MTRESIFQATLEDIVKLPLELIGSSVSKEALDLARSALVTASHWPSSDDAVEAVRRFQDAHRAAFGQAGPNWSAENIADEQTNAERALLALVLPMETGK